MPSRWDASRKSAWPSSSVRFRTWPTTTRSSLRKRTTVKKRRLARSPLGKILKLCKIIAILTRLIDRFKKSHKSTKRFNLRLNLSARALERQVIWIVKSYSLNWRKRMSTRTSCNCRPLRLQKLFGKRQLTEVCASLPSPVRLTLLRRYSPSSSKPSRLWVAPEWFKIEI